MRKRLISALLALSLLLVLFPAQALADDGPGNASSLFIEIDGRAVVEDRAPAAGAVFPAGVSYSEHSRTLTLNGASFSHLGVNGHGDDLTIVLLGDSQIRSTGEGSALEAFDVSLTVKGPGSLAADGENGGLNAGHSDVRITDGATVNAQTVRAGTPENGSTAFVCENGSLTVDGGASVSALGYYGTFLSGRIVLNDCAFHTNLLHLHDSGETAADRSLLTVGNGAVVNVRIDDQLIRNGQQPFMVLDGSRMEIDGGTVRIDSEDADPALLNGIHDYHCFAIQPFGADGNGVGSSVELKDGLLAISGAANGLLVHEDTTFIQSGGVLTVEAGLNNPGVFTTSVNVGGTMLMTGGEARLNAVGGMFVQHGGFLSLNGGHLASDSMQNGILLRDASALVINGGTVEARGDENGMALSGYSGFSMLDGELTLRSNSATGFGVESNDGFLRILGGAMSVESGDQRCVLNLRAEDDSCFVLGSGMYAVDNQTGREAELRDLGGRYLCPSKSVTFSGRGGAYSGALSVAAGEIVQGAPFTVRADLAPGEPSGTVTFTLPSGISWIPGSLSVNGAAAAPLRTDPLTVALDGASTVRFSAVAEETGSFTISSATAVPGKGTFRETLEVAVVPFRLSLPTRTARTTIPVSGSARPGSTITFREGDRTLGTAKVNALAAWTGTVTLPGTAGEHAVYAVIDYPGGGSSRSETQTVVYAPDADEVKTLTVSNYVHGMTSADPPVQNTLVIDYTEMKTSRGYYSFWPDMPTLSFRVDFVKDAAAIGSATVITADRMGREVRTPLRYSAAEDAWLGENDFTETTVPAKFRVEFSQTDGSEIGTGTMEPEYDEVGTVSPWPAAAEAEPVIRDESDGTFVTGGADFTFRVSDPSALTLTDSAGNGVDFTVAAAAGGGYTVRGSYAAGDLYTAKLSSGEFPEYPGEKALFILIGGGGPGKGYREYREGVVTADAVTPELQTPGSVIVLEDQMEAWYVQADGSLVEAGLEDVYETLLVTQNDLDPTAEFDMSGFGFGAEEAFRQSSTYAAVEKALYRMAEAYSDDMAGGKESSGDGSVGKAKKLVDGVEVSVETELMHGNTSQSGDDVPAEVMISIRIKATLNTKIGTIYASILLRKVLQYQPVFRVEIEDHQLRTLFYTSEETETSTVAFQASLGEEPSESLGNELEKYFKEAENERRLEEEELSEPQSNEFLLGEIWCPTTIPGLRIVVRVGLNFSFQFCGELSLQYQSKTETGSGMIYQNGKAETFKKKPETSNKGVGVDLHVTARAEAGVVAYGGISLLNVINVLGYFKEGLAGVFEGHGSVNSNKSAEDNRVEVFAGINLVTDLGIKFEIRLSRLFHWDLDKKIFSAEIPLYQFGLKLTPARFSYVETEPIYVSRDCNLRELIDMNLNYMSFEHQSMGGPLQDFPILKKVFAEDGRAHYEFSIRTDCPLTVTPEGMLHVPAGLTEEFDFTVRLTYFGRGRDYELYKEVPMRYTPASIVIRKEIRGARPIAEFSVTDRDTGASLGTWTTNDAGLVTVPVAPGRAYVVTETNCAAGYRPVERTQTVEADGTVTFVNETWIPSAEDPIVFVLTPWGEIKYSLDPSGYVYEGIESNRLEGVTTTLYYSGAKTKPTANATEGMRWNAAEFDQENPLTTDALGQYLWMVPDGWWQVKYEKAGYETVYSDWLPVPPVQTDVNVAMVSRAAAQLTVSVEPGSDPILRFDRPVLLSTALNGSVQVTWNGQLPAGKLTPVDSGMLDDGRLCATVFRFAPDDGRTLRNGDRLSVRYDGVVTYAGTASSGSVSVNYDDPMPFRDVSVSDYFYKAVLWAVERGVTSGTSPTAFSPNSTCTRAQVVTFLWRAMGSPEPASAVNRFTDVQPGAYYYKAVLWAVEQGITSGTSGTTFSPNSGCTRGQVVTFLWRMEIKPAASKTGAFADVPAGQYYTDAVNWAVQEKITSGTSATTFSPNSICTRGQIVTFLYRDMG